MQASPVVAAAQEGEAPGKYSAPSSPLRKHEIETAFGPVSPSGAPAGLGWHCRRHCRVAERPKRKWNSAFPL